MLNEMIMRFISFFQMGGLSSREYWTVDQIVRETFAARMLASTAIQLNHLELTFRYITNQFI